MNPSSTPPNPQGRPSDRDLDPLASGVSDGQGDAFGNPLLGPLSGALDGVGTAPGPRRRSRGGRDALLLVGVLWIAFLLAAALYGTFRLPDPTLAAGDPHLAPGVKGFALGTDDIGRDFLARVARGALVSLGIGLTVQLIVVVVGVVVGVLGEFGPKWIAVPLMRLTDGMFAFPDILLAILIVGVLKAGWIPVIVALSVAGWPTTARLVKAQSASLRDREFVVAARAAGAGVPYLVLRHILPQLTGILLAVSVVELAGTILAESTLSFLGIGVQAPTPTWGGMINAARQNLASYPRELVWPCVALTVTIMALSFIGDGLRDRFDPKGR